MQKVWLKYWCIWKWWTPGPNWCLPDINYKLWQVSERGWAQVFRDPHPSGKSWKAKLWISTQAITAWLSTHTTSSTQTTRSENIPSSLTNLICHQPQPTAVFTPPGLLIGLILLIELHLRNMWESGLVAYQDCTHPVIWLCPITTINICNNKCLNCS